MTDDYSIDAYDFHLPENQIAQTPAPKREDSRLLVIDRAESTTTQTTMNHFSEFLSGDEVLVVNDTRVVPARLAVTKETGGKVELLILPPGPNPDPRFASAMSRASRPLAKGMKLTILGESRSTIEVADVIPGGRVQLEFTNPGGVREVLTRHGSVPLPPYIRRDERGGPSDEDKSRYQTVFARNKGAVAAPTAGLHFTASLVTKIENLGVPVVSVTLHVGPGTFLPVRETDLRKHQVEGEWVSMGFETARVLNKARAEGRRIIAVGTTVVRTLESLVGEDGSFEPTEKLTDLTILPEHQFKAVDGLLTNFHLPKSSLLVLVSAFCGRERVLKAYKEAVDSGFRFYSYGDAMYIR